MTSPTPVESQSTVIVAHSSEPTAGDSVMSVGPQRSVGKKSFEGLRLSVLNDQANRKLNTLPALKTNDLGERIYELVEVYDSVKGEGCQAGVPMTFLRFAKCNLACDFCDTPYNRVSFTAAASTLAIMIAERRPAWVILTGGEPMLQLMKDGEHLLNDIRTRCAALGEPVKFAIETNGMLMKPEIARQLDYINISPKTAYTTPEDVIPVDKRISPVLRDMHNAGEITIDEIRSIICSRTDEPFIASSLGLTRHPKHYTFSPLMADIETLPDNWVSGMGHPSHYGIIDGPSMDRCLELAKQWRHVGGRVSIQTHKFIGVR